MDSAFVLSNGGAGSPTLAEDLSDVGIAVVGRAKSVETLVQDVVRIGHDLVVCYDFLSDALFSGTTFLRSVSPRPVVVFTTDPNADKIERATASGIHAYVINGYACTVCAR